MPSDSSQRRARLRAWTRSLARSPLLDLGDHRRERALLPPGVAEHVALAGGSDQRRLRQHLRLELGAEGGADIMLPPDLGEKFKAQVLPQATLIAAAGQRHNIGDAGWEESAFAPMVAEIKKW